MKNKSRVRFGKAAIGRRLIQTGFLLLFLFPFLPAFYARMIGTEAPVFSSWLLPFDGLLHTAASFHGDLQWVIPGTILFILAFSFVFGRVFCGWICPLGTVLDWINPLAFWQKKSVRRPSAKNSRARFLLLAVVLAASFVSLQLPGWLDPLIIFNRSVSAIFTNVFLSDPQSLRVIPFGISLFFVAIVVLELIRPRFWCRHLCPFGAFISLPARFSLLNRRVTNDCTYCGDCRNMCSMNAIGVDPHDTRYMDCTFCLDCESACPNQGIKFEFGKLALTKWQRRKEQNQALQPVAAGSYFPVESTKEVKVTRRQALEVLAAGAAGLAVAPLISTSRGSRGLVRPPGALPEEQFSKSCVTCQECIRVCPSRALRPAFLEGGLASIGTPFLAPRQGACSFESGCPQLCAQVCPVGAIRPIPVSEMKIGVAVVDHSACLAWDQGVKCLVCVEACLSDAAKSVNGKIILDAEKCTGCGRCESGCPVPGSAIRVEPA